MVPRRSFLSHLTAGVVGAALGPRMAVAADPVSGTGSIMTVDGWVSVSNLGVFLPHEHVLTDFVGAEKFAQPRYRRDEAMEVVRPHFKRLRERGVTALCECTPKYIGRDVRFLRQLSDVSGIHILTNTGYYGAVGNKFLPRHAREETAEQLANRWLREWTDGIDGTGIKPGFIKLGVDRGKLPPLHEKLVRAAAQVHRQSGLTICIHTGDGVAALDEFRILREERVRPESFVWVHAQNDPGPMQIELAKQGVWVSLDGYNLKPGAPERYRDRLVALKEAGCLNRILVSHDDGWAVEGEEERSTGLKPFGNGNPEPYASIFTRLLGDLNAAGFSKTELDQLTRRNPAQAMAIRQ